MKINELFIGAWVMDGIKPAEVTGITCDGIVETTVNESSNIEVINPIPLTPEILMKNGFVYSDLPFIQGWQQFGLTLYRGGKGYLINCGENIAMVVNYVHQLQQALRLCGAEKEIIIL